MRGSRVIVVMLSGLALAGLDASAASAATMPSVRPAGHARSSASLHVLAPGEGTCGGIVAFRQQARVAGRTVAELDVYASDADGGRFVACTRHLGWAAGVRLITRVGIIGADDAGGRGRVASFDAGRFSQFAGPVGIGGARGRCFRATGSISAAGHILTMSSPMVCARAK